MKKIIGTASALMLGLMATASAQAQYGNHNYIRDSGNGAHNRIFAENVSGHGYMMRGGANRNLIHRSGNGINNTIMAKNFSGGGFGPVGFDPRLRGIRPGLGFRRGGGIPPGIGPDLPFVPDGVNVNVITNSGNGQGNLIRAGNAGRGWLNINVLTNSGNGVGNTIIAGNR